MVVFIFRVYKCLRKVFFHKKQFNKSFFMFLNLILYILLKNSVVIKIVDVQEQN